MSDKVEITKAISQYLQSPFSQYAIHIDGGWGQGKTHYIRTELIPALTGKTSVGYFGKKNYKCLYVSLFGLSTKQDIDNAILGTLATAGEGVFSSALKTIFSSIAVSDKDSGVRISGGAVGAVMSGVFNILRQNQLNKLENNSESIVFFFDDLERFSGEIVHPMAYISKLVESVTAKCIILCNEMELSQLNQSNGEIALLQGGNEFKKFKEKVIGTTIKFDLSEIELTDTILDIAGKERGSCLYNTLKASFESKVEYNIKVGATLCNNNQFFSYGLKHRKNIRTCLKVFFFIEQLLHNYKIKLQANPLRTFELIIYHLDQLNVKNFENDLVNYKQSIDWEFITKGDMKIVDDWLSCGFIEDNLIQKTMDEWAPINFIEKIKNSNSFYAGSDGLHPNDLFKKGINELEDSLNNEVTLSLKDLLNVLIFIMQHPFKSELWKKNVKRIVDLIELQSTKLDKSDYDKFYWCRNTFDDFVNDTGKKSQQEAFKTVIAERESNKEYFDKYCLPLLLNVYNNLGRLPASQT